MACFIVPATEAVVSTVVKKVVEKKENQVEETMAEADVKVEKFSSKLGRLNKMLWGGSALLAFEHVWHGEVTAFFPFLTAAESSENLAEMLTEMSTVGVGMAILTTVVWAVSCVITDKLDKGVMVKGKASAK